MRAYFVDTLFNSLTFGVLCHTRVISVCITEPRLFKYTEHFITKNWKFSDKNSDIFHISAQNIDCGYLLEPPRRGGSNKYPQTKFLSGNKKNNVYPCKPQFYYIKVGFKGSKLHRYAFVMVAWEGCMHGCAMSLVHCFFFFFSNTV